MGYLKGKHVLVRKMTITTWIIIKQSHVIYCLVPRPYEKRSGNFHEFKLFRWQKSIKFQNTVTWTAVKPNCIMHLSVTVTPIPFQQVIQNIKNVTRCRDSRTAKSLRNKVGMIIKQSSIQPPTGIFFHNTCRRKRYVRGLYTWLFYDHPYLVSLLFAVQLSYIL